MAAGGWKRRSRALVVGALVLLVGCGWTPGDADSAAGANDGTDDEQVLSGTPERPPAADEFDEIESNDDFASAQPISFAESVQLNGTIAGGSDPLDRDIYDLGPAEPGDRILAELSINANNDIILGILDDRQRLLGHVDPLSGSAGPVLADVVVREASSTLYVVVGTRSPLSANRPYSADISILRGTAAAALRPQVLVLNFSGATAVRIGSRSPVDVPPFDAGAISPAFAGQTETLIAAILAIVRADFEGLGVDVYRDTDPDLPAGDHSTIYYGTFDSRLLGLADNVDPYNSQAVQSAILYTDTFAIFNVLLPSLQQMAQTLGNTTSHEAGHLLGLRHTSDPTDLMDTTATARQMMLDQEFSFAALNDSVLPVGSQDSPVLLSWTVGGSLLDFSASAKVARRQKSMRAAAEADDFYIPREWLMNCSCTNCGQP